MAVTPAGALAGLLEEEQKKVVAGGAKEAARKVRELRTGKSNADRAQPAPSPRASLGSFGVVDDAYGPRPSGEVRNHGVVFLWLAPGGLVDTNRGAAGVGFPLRPIRRRKREPGGRGRSAPARVWRG